MSSLQASDLRDDDTVYSNEKALLEMFDPGREQHMSGCRAAYATFKICVFGTGQSQGPALLLQGADDKLGQTLWQHSKQ